MTYKEFKDWCEDNGYNVADTKDDIYVGEKLLHSSSVSKVYRNSMYTVSNGDVPEDLFRKLMELTSTPLEEREGPKLYHVILPYSEDSFCALSDGSGIIHMYGYHDDDLKMDRFRLTEDEIKAIDPRYMAFAVEVKQ